MKIPFNIPYLTGKEKKYILDALKSSAHCGNLTYGRRCISLMKEKNGFKEVFLTPSCTSALEMGILLMDIRNGDEVILPSYTFSSTANAIVLRNARPVFCEIEPDTMNIDVTKIESLITEKTKMILPIDYAGIPCEIETIMEIAGNHNLAVMTDAAQSYNSFYKDKPCGSQPDLAAFSFHESKNYTCGEGGALIVNRAEWIERAHFLQEKGTDRSLVLKKLKNKYSWVDIGSSFLLSDILAAMLLAQLENADHITNLRSKITSEYFRLFSPYKEAGHLRIPDPPDYVRINHHAFFVIFDTPEARDKFLEILRGKSIFPYIGYMPLHSSPMGKRLGYRPEDLRLTEDISSCIVRLPFYTGLAENGLEYCLDGMKSALDTIYNL